MKLLTTTSAKIDKSQNDEWLNAIMYLDPSYNKQVCKAKSKGCYDSCIRSNGRLGMQSSVTARYNRTHLYFSDYNTFMLILRGEILQLLGKAARQGKRLALRLNGTSDLDFSCVYQEFPMVMFYEYTKRVDLLKRIVKHDNVHVTFSRTEKHTEAQIKKVIGLGVNVAVVFDAPKHELPNTFMGIPVIDGDISDRRFEDKQGSIVGLALKGRNKVKEAARVTGFAVPVDA
jgi:hypothetical protein